MRYVRNENDTRIEYDVSFDIEFLNEIRKEIIRRCGIRTHVSIKTYCPRIYMSGVDSLFVEKYIETPTGEKIEQYDEEKEIYHVEYNLINEPKLSRLIYNFLNKADMKLIDSIMFEDEFVDDSPNGTIEYKQSEKDSLSNELEKIFSGEKYETKRDFTKIRLMLDELEQICTDIELNKKLNLQEQSSYIPLLKDAIKLTEVARYVKVKTLVK